MRVAVLLMGNDVGVGFVGASDYLEMDGYKTEFIYNVLHLLCVLTDERTFTACARLTGAGVPEASAVANLACRSRTHRVRDHGRPHYLEPL